MKQTISEEYQKLKNHYKSLKLMEPSQESKVQIERDLGRTFPKHEYFQSGSKGIKQLRSVLKAFACYDKQVDYVQGMNFMVG